MKKIITALFLIIATTAFAEIRVVTTYPYIADIAKKIGRHRVKTQSLAPGSWDPHFVVPKPSLIAKVRRADLLIINGAELEIGWLPPIVRESRNARVQPGANGFLDLSGCIELIDIPENISRAHGDVHPSGNPHFSLNPDNITKISIIILKRLCVIDSDNSSFYKKNHEEFHKLWNKKLKKWDEAMKPLKGMKVIQYHKIFDYLFQRYEIVGVTEIEPLPGITPTSRHIMDVINRVRSEGVKLVINDVYHSTKPAQLIARKTGVKMIVLPHDVGAVQDAKDIVALFDNIVRRLTK